MDETNKLFEALAKAQGEFPVIPKDTEVKVYSKPPDRRLLYAYKYADLTTIISCCRPALSKNNLSFTQSFTGNGFETRIMHASGQFLVCGFIPCIMPQGADMKTIAGIVTYAKRISLTAALGISADEDLDSAAHEAQNNNSTEKKSYPQSPQSYPQPKSVASAPKKEPIKKSGFSNVKMPWEQPPVEFHEEPPGWLDQYEKPRGER